MRNTITMTLSKLAAAAALTFAALPGSAQSALSDSMTVRDGTGVIVEQLVVSQAREIDAGHGFIFMLSTAIDPGQFGNYTTLYDDPANVNSTGDIFGIAGVGGGVFLGFSSDIDGLDLSSVYGGAGPNAFFEGSAASFDATRYLDLALQAAGWTATFISDGDTPVSEPAGLGLMALAGLGLLASRKRLVKSA